MTLATTVSRASYPGTGSTGPFAYPFQINVETDLLVTKRNVSSVETTLNWPADFTVTGVKNPTGTITLTVALAAGETLVLRRSPPLTQPASIKNQGPYFPQTIEDEMDRLVMQVQALQDQISRAPKLSESYDPSAYTTGIAPLAGQVIAVNAGATGFETRTVSSSATLLPGGGRLVPDLSTYVANNAVFNALDYAVPANAAAIFAGTSDATPCSNLAIAAARTVGGTFIWPSGGRWRFDSPLNLTFNAGDNALLKRPITLRNEGNTGVGPSSDASSGNMVINHNGHGADCAGGYDFIFWNWNWAVAAGKTPICAWFCARNTANSGAGHHQFNGCKAYGPFLDSVYYGYGSEQNWFDAGTYFVNTQAGGAVCTITGYNINARVSTFITVATGSQSNTVHKFRGNYNASNAGGHTFYLEACNDILIDAWCFSASGSADGHCLVHVAGTNGASSYVTLTPLTGENGTFLAQYGIYLDNIARTHSFYTFMATRTSTRTRAVFASANVTMANVSIEQFGEVATPTGIEIQGILTDSYIKCDRTLIIGTSIRNVLIGDPTNWTIGTRTNGVHINPTLSQIDCFGHKFPITMVPSADAKVLDDYEEGTFTPILGGSTSEAGQTYGTRNGKYVKWGRAVFYSGEVAATVIGTITGTVRIKGLPFTSGPTSRAGASIRDVGVLGIAVTEIGGYVESSSTYIDIYHRAAAAVTPTNSPNTMWANNTQIFFAGVYNT